MGSWDETCGISQMPVTRGDACRYLLLLEVRPTPPNGFSYATGTWTPLVPPLRGVYEDHGEVTFDVDDAAHAAIVASTERILRAGGFDLGLHALVGHLRGQRPWDVDGHVALKRSRDGAYRGRVGYVVLREDVYAGVADMVVDPGAGRTPEPLSAAYFRGEIDAWARDVSGASGTKDAWLKEMEWDATYLFSCFRRSDPTPIREVLRDVVRKLSSGERSLLEVAPLLDEVAKFLLVCEVVELTRRHWSPQAGRGSQDTSRDLHEALWGLFGTCASGLRERWK